MLSRIGAILLLMTAGFYAWAHETGFVLRTPMAEALKAELNAKADPKQVQRLIDAAIARDDAAEAEMYVEIAAKMGVGISPAIVEKLKAALTPEAKLLRNAEEFGAAAVSGAGTSEAALAGAMGAEAGTSGDLRDIMLEGSKFASGGTYDQVVLGLSLAGLALGEDKSAVERAKAAGIWKVAHRNGLLQGEMRAKLLDALVEAVAMDDLKGVLVGLSFSSREEANAALLPIAAKTRIAALEPYLAAGSQLIVSVGDAEAVKLAALARSPEELTELAKLSAELGPVTRGVVVLADVRKVSDINTTQTLEEAAQLNPVPIALWTAVLLSMIALGDFQLIGRLPRSRPRPQERMFRKMPVRQLQSLDGDAQNQR